MMKVLAGDFKKGSYAVIKTTYWLSNFKRLMLSRGFFKNSSYKAQEIVSAELLDGHNKTSILGKVAWGGAGLVTLGGLGLLAGVLGGGNKNIRVVLLSFLDGRSVMLQCNVKEYTMLLTATACHSTTDTS